jgi:hypothetical protein
MDGEVRWQDLIAPAIAVDAQRFTIGDVEQGLSEGYYQLWKSDTAAMITSGFITQAGGIGVNVIATGGEMSAAMALLDQVESLARESGCETIQFVGRLGWKSEAKKRGFSHTASTYAKALRHPQ